jgi:uncharacterized BrkB/YihY/UPF0761 family membrane protein
MPKRITSWRPVQVVMAYGKSQGGNYAASHSFNAFVAMFPVLLRVLAIVGFVVNDRATQKPISRATPAQRHELVGSGRATTDIKSAPAGATSGS